MKYSFKIILPLISLCLYSCVVLFYGPTSLIRKRFTNCYTGENTGIESKLNINGYFLLKKHSEYREFNRNIRYDREERAIFYPDGTFVHDENIEYFPVEESLGKPGGYMRWMGIYSLKADTIVVQYINHPARGAPTWAAFEESFIIIDRNTIHLIPNSLKYLHENEEREKERLATMISYDKSGYFVQNDSLPNPNQGWLKNEDWFWCDEAKFDEWKASLKK